MRMLALCPVHRSVVSAWGNQSGKKGLVAWSFKSAATATKSVLIKQEMALSVFSKSRKKVN